MNSANIYGHWSNLTNHFIYIVVIRIGTNQLMRNVDIQWKLFPLIWVSNVELTYQNLHPTFFNPELSLHHTFYHVDSNPRGIKSQLCFSEKKNISNDAISIKTGLTLSNFLVTKSSLMLDESEWRLNTTFRMIRHNSKCHDL